MTTKKVLVTGGAGFIGSHLIDSLLEKGHVITVYDNLEPQVHGKITTPPDYLARDITFIRNDVRNRELLQEAITNTEVIFHLAAMVGVGQSMYQIERYVDTNILGTAKLLDILVNEPNEVEKLVVASSMSTYGEGRYICEDCGKINPELRKNEQMEKGDWELNCPFCGKKIIPVPTDEEKEQDCTSIYALTKKEQEKECLLIGKTYGINTTALRFFNAYGSRQSLSNPYTGVCAIFSSNLLCGNSPTIYEDGNQSRDFIHVKDICQSLLLSMEKPEAQGEIFNVGSGQKVTVLQIAKTLADKINQDIMPNITGKFRPGDVRHCFSDISKISNKLDFKPEYSFKDGMEELIQWVKLQQGAVEDKSIIANKELREKGLL
ncbi:MAG: GDP-mannose 4,6-dehydratase [Promethearchaeota archaeon]